MTLNEYFKKATLYPTMVAMVAVIIFSIIDNYNYKSEWMDAGMVVMLTIVAALVYCLIVTLLSLPIFLVTYPKINQSKIATFLSWFLLPFGFIAVVLIDEMSFKIKYNRDYTYLVYIILINIPFIIALIGTYWKYNKNKNATEAFVINGK